jgi:hypothetical protein
MLSTAEADEISDAMGRRREFCCPTNWHRSKKGNLTRLWRNRSLTVFQHCGRYKYVINEEDGPRFSPIGWDTEEEAVAALRDELSV